MSISQCDEKILLVIYFLNPGYVAPVTTQIKCGTVPTQDFNFQIKLFCLTDEMIQTNGKAIAMEIQSLITKCTQVLMRMTDMNGIRDEFLNNIQNIPQNSFLYYTDSGGLILREAENKETRKFKKIYNVSFEGTEYSEKQNTYDEKTDTNTNMINFPLTTLILDSMQVTLECMSWFKHFSQKAFECASGRLIQISGTCFLNAVVNGIFLSPGIQLLLFHEYMKEVREGRFEGYRELKTLACPMPSEQNSKKFIFTLVHELMANRKRLRNKSLDILKSSSGLSFSSSISGEGGSSLFSLIEILNSLRIDYLLKIPEAFTINTYDIDLLDYCTIDMDQSQKKEYVFPYPISRKEFYDASSRNTLVSFFTTKYSRTALQLMENTSILIEYQTFYQLRNLPEKQYNGGFQVAKPVIEREGTKFDLQFCNLTIRFESGSSHALLGMICNGVYQIYDSYTNFFFNYDWQTMYKSDDFIMEMERHFQVEIIKYSRDFTVYMRSDLIKELHEQQREINLPSTVNIF
jgi:hypothetical protein